MAGSGFDIRIERGVAELEQLGRDLKTAGAKDLRKELLAAGRRITKPVKAAIHAHAVSDLPKKGGLNEWAAGRLKTVTQTRLTGKNVGVTVKTRAGGSHSAKGLNDGLVRHPLHGDRQHWYAQRIAPGFETRAVDELAEQIRAEFLAAVAAVADQLAARG